ncbi:MAG: DUF4251 domain-containing protein [Ginsengibacter sp.]
MKIRPIQSLVTGIAFLFLALVLFQCTSSKKVIAIGPGDALNMIQAHEFKFVAESVTPLRGRMRHLTSLYDVMVKKDSLVSYLPYFGRAYQAPINSSEGGIQFTSTQFSYEVTNDKRNSWNVSIKPGTQRDVEQFLFTIFDNGTATLSVTSTYRDPISFYCSIQKTE